MKMRLVAAAVIGLTMSTAIVAADASTPATTTTPATSAPATSLNSDMDKLSYSIGADLGKILKTGY